MKNTRLRELAGPMVLLLVGLLVCLSGCATPVQKDSIPKTQGMLEPSSVLKFNDIPVPAGFKVLTKDSYSFETGNVRVGILKYQGKANSDQVVNFYKEQMAMYNWNLLNSIEYGERLLNFEREGESCIVTVMPKGSGSLLTISFGPKAQALPKKTKEPVK